jgi:lysozyme family protein
MPSNKQKIGAAAVGAAIIASVFAVEGGYVSNPRDPGGATSHGITEAVARADGYTGRMQDLPKDRAQAIYWKNYITEPGFEPFLTLSPAVAHELVDSGVSAGPYRSSRWLQVSLNALNRDGKDYPDLKVDGKIGPGTVKAYQSLVKVRGSVKACQMVLKLLDAQQAQHYLSLTSMETFMPGWVDNRISNVPLSDCR